MTRKRYGNVTVKNITTCNRWDLNALTFVDISNVSRVKLIYYSESGYKTTERRFPKQALSCARLCLSQFQMNKILSFSVTSKDQMYDTWHHLLLTERILTRSNEILKTKPIYSSKPFAMLRCKIRSIISNIILKKKALVEGKVEPLIERYVLQFTWPA